MSPADLPQLPDNIKFHAQFDNMTDKLQADLEKLAREQLIKLSGSYLKPYVSKPNAVIKVSIRVIKNKIEKYEWKFHFTLDWEDFYWDNDVPFKEPLDVVSHAFKHLKEHLANK